MASKIVYRVVAAVIAACTFPIAVFSPLIRIVADPIIGEAYIYYNASFYGVYKMFFAKGSGFNGFAEGAEISDALRGQLPYLTATGVCLGLLLLSSLAIIIFAAVSNKRAVILGLSVFGFGLIIAMFVLFGKFAAPFTDGTISLGDLGLIESGILKSILSMAMSIKVLQLTTGVFMFAFIYIALLMWTAAFMLTETGDKKQKA
ncbi:MAG: hypothetical protein K6F09_01175 [Clostridiales bacterium]|nr:hypothetical protein [Clostridiales bacterium]